MTQDTPRNHEAVVQAAAALQQARATRRTIPQVSATFGLQGLETAYAVAEINTRARLETGARIVGKKVGLTSKAVQQQLGVDQPDFGILFADMEYLNAQEVPTARLIQPKVEAEVAFIVGRDGSGAKPSWGEFLQAIAFAVPALEIVDSAIDDWKITLFDTVADNASSGLLVVGGRMRPVTDLDLRLIGVVVSRNGEMIDTGAGAAALGNPARCVAWLANKLGSLGAGLRAGDVVLPGAVHKMVPVQPGDVFRAEFSRLGAVTARFSR
jgi:2-keto-4-pentenoate hydratase